MPEPLRPAAVEADVDSPDPGIAQFAGEALEPGSVGRHNQLVEPRAEPRPERPEFIEQLTEQVPGYLNRLGLKPGLTGIAQVVNGYDNNIESFKRKVALDLLYLQNCCFWNDIKILFRTIRVVLTGSGAL